MHLRTVTSRRNGKAYRYVQLVESYRRKSDQMPSHRVIATLGDLPENTVLNLKAALEASRANKSVVVLSEEALELKPPTVTANLRYLDLGVALWLWRQWNVPELLEELLGPLDAQVSLADVLAALVLQRCVAPGSKLCATRWFPTTSLPELLGIAPGQFNNSRIHRALEELDRVGEKLQSRLSTLYSARDGAFATLFIDVTDTWFEGQGPPLAQRSLTKDGTFKQRIGIVLLCNEVGYPLRWAVVAGKQPDSQCIAEMLQKVAGCSFVEQVPVVCDRAMGQGSSVHKMLQSGLRFLTAAPVNEMETYTGQHSAFEKLGALPMGLGEQTQRSDVQRAAEAAQQAGFQRVGNEELYVLELGLLELAAPDEPPRAAEREPARKPGALGPQGALELAQQLQRSLAEPCAPSQRQVGKLHGYSQQHVSALLGLLELPEDLQQAIGAAQAEALTLKELFALRRLSEPQQQRAAFDQMLCRRLREPPKAPARASRRARPRPPAQMQPPSDPSCLRAVLCFDPHRCFEQRQRAERHLAELHDFVRKLNERLLSARSRMSEADIYRHLNDKLKHRNLVELFDVLLQTRPVGTSSHWQVQLHFKEPLWARRRRHDGFFLLLAHPELVRSGAELVLLYRAKDKVEKDFQTIKGLVRLRPVRHRTDPKVRAHVTLCMLALLLERSLERRLAGTAQKLTAAAAFEILSTCHLNRHRMPRSLTPFYSLTELTDDQRSVLRALGLEHLGQNEAVTETILPR